MLCEFCKQGPERRERDGDIMQMQKDMDGLAIILYCGVVTVKYFHTAPDVPVKGVHSKVCTAAREEERSLQHNFPESSQSHVKTLVNSIRKIDEGSGHKWNWLLLVARSY